MEAAFDAGRTTSDGGLLLLRELIMRTGLLRQFAGCFTDNRDPGRIEHSVEELLTQRVLGIICGYEDLNDHERLRDDSLLALAVGKADVTGATRKRQRDQGHALAGKSTLNRLELAAPNVDAAERYKKISYDDHGIERLLVQHFLDSHASPPTEIVLDSMDGQRFRGLVVEVSPRLNRSKATATVKVRFKDAPKELRPEMSARVSFRSEDELGQMALGFNAMADAMLSADGEAQARALRAAAELYAPALGVSARHVVEASYSTRDRMKTLADAMGVRVAHDAPARRLLEDTQVMEDAKTVAHPPPASAAALAPTLPATASSSVLSHAVADLQSRRQAGTLRAAESLPLALDAMHRGVAFRWPANSASPGATSIRSGTARKMPGCGFIRPCSDDDTLAEIAEEIFDRADADEMVVDADVLQHRAGGGGCDVDNRFNALIVEHVTRDAR